jgi:hypothetical protein
MERERVPESVKGCRAEARRLWKHLNGSDSVRARAAAGRLARLEPFAAGGAEGVLAGRRSVQRKHALAAVATELGYASWNELVRVFEARAVRPSFHTARMESLVNRWFVSLAEARAVRAADGGYLLPFGRQFVVTEAEGVRALGLDPDDPDWERVGYDLVDPRDRAAFERLCARRRAALAAGIGPASREVAR